MTETKTKRQFSFTIWYFKPSGKFYSEGTMELATDNCGSDQHPTAYMQDAVDHICGLRDGKGNHMPGLSGRWHGPILVNCEDGYPCLIPGREA